MRYRGQWVSSQSADKKIYKLWDGGVRQKGPYLVKGKKKRGGTQRPGERVPHRLGNEGETCGFGCWRSLAVCSRIAKRDRSGRQIHTWGSVSIRMASKKKLVWEPIVDQDKGVWGGVPSNKGSWTKRAV